MRKRESLYLHALLALVREDFEHNRDLQTDAFDEYEAMDVSPTGIHRSKDAHRRAVFALAPELGALADRATDGGERRRLDAGRGTDQYAE
ncbi:UPF0058 family protein [Halosimplex amylolyticum]|uniref:UPF0058 family protein n=1 Tax=Halosimplex amylolyticum TaxID=3396616 RepID=UPI003F54F964